MSTKCAPSNADIFMGMFEERYLYPLIETMSKFRLRFRDNNFLIWTGTTDQLMNFKQQINKVPPSIKLGFNFSHKKTNFLDTSFNKKNQVIWKPSSTGKNPIDRCIYIINQNTLSL